MTVLVIVPRARGGLAAHAAQEVAALRAAGVEVRESAARIRERPSLRADLATVRLLRRELRALAPADGRRRGGAHAHGLRAGALAALALPRGAGRPVLVVTLHNRTVGSRPVRAVGALLLRILARRADSVLAVSPDLAADARRAGARDVRHALVPAPGWDRSTAEPGEPGSGTAPPDVVAPVPAGTAGEELDVLVVARLAPQKGLGDLLDALGRMPREGLRVRIAGDGPLRAELAARIAAEHLPVELLGWREDVPTLLAAADLVVSVAHWEGQPVALQEALRAGRAIVATDAGGTRWVTGEAATLVPVGDPAALAAAVLAHRDPVLRERAEQAARRRAGELPTARDMTDQLLDLLAPGHQHW